MKYTIASLIACLCASSVEASYDGWWWYQQPKVVIEKKQAFCHFTTTIYDHFDLSVPRFLFDLHQVSKDGEVDSFKLAMQASNIDAPSPLSVNSYGEADCAGDATTVVDGGIYVRSRWH